VGFNETSKKMYIRDISRVCCSRGSVGTMVTWPTTKPVAPAGSDHLLLD